MYSEKIELRKKRDFGDKINATFEFLRLNFKPLFKAILFIALPIVMICAIAMSLASSVLGGIGTETATGLPQAYEQLLNLYTSPVIILIFIVMIIVMIIVMSLGFVFTLAVTYEFMLIYMENGDTNDIGVLWKRSLKHIWRLIIGSIGNSILIALLFLILFGVIASFSILGTGGVIAGFFFGFFAFFGIFILISPLLLVYPIQVIESASYGQALGRVFQLVKGREWFSTAGLAIIMLIVYYFMQLIFSIPFQIINFSTSFHSLESGTPASFGIGSVITYVISLLGSFFTIPVFWVSMAFQYFNLVEKRELVGLMSEIDKIGAQKEDNYNNEEGY